MARHSLGCSTQAAATATTAVAGTPATLTWRDTARASARSAARKSWCVPTLVPAASFRPHHAWSAHLGPTPRGSAPWACCSPARSVPLRRHDELLLPGVPSPSSSHPPLAFAPQARAKHDSGNSAAAGCFTGGVLARGGAESATRALMRCQHLLTPPGRVRSGAAGHGGGLRHIRRLLRPHGHDPGHALVRHGEAPSSSPLGAAQHPATHLRSALRIPQLCMGGPCSTPWVAAAAAEVAGPAPCSGWHVHGQRSPRCGRALAAGDHDFRFMCTHRRRWSIARADDVCASTHIPISAMPL